MGGSGGTDVCLRGAADGCVALAHDATSMCRPRRARCIADGWRKVAACRSTAYPRKRPRACLLHPQPKVPPRDFGTPLSRRPNPMPWAGFSLPIAGAGLPSLILGSGGRLAAQPS